jgi:hypothetical protein
MERAWTGSLLPTRAEAVAQAARAAVVVVIAVVVKGMELENNSADMYDCYHQRKGGKAEVS